MIWEELNLINVITMPEMYGNYVLKKSYGFQQSMFLVVIIKKQMIHLEFSKMLPNESLSLTFSTKLWKNLGNIDLFVSKISRQSEKYVTWVPEAEATAIEAFSLI